MNYILTTKTESELYHHGVKGMKWGVRRYQTKSGSLTPEGKKRRSEERKRKVKEFIEDVDQILRGGKPIKRPVSYHLDLEQMREGEYGKRESQIIKKYNKKMTNAKTEDEREMLELDMLEEIDDLISKSGSRSPFGGYGSFERGIEINERERFRDDRREPSQEELNRKMREMNEYFAKEIAKSRAESSIESQTSGKSIVNDLKNKHYDKQLEKEKKKTKSLREKEKLKVKKDKLDSLKEKNTSKKEALKSNTSTTKSKSETQQKTVKDLSDTELRNRVNRMQLEAQYAQYSKSDMTRGQKIVNEVLNKVLIPAVEEQGKTILKDIIDTQYKKRKTK